jgi:hypothetical protein
VAVASSFLSRKSRSSDSSAGGHTTGVHPKRVHILGFVQQLRLLFVANVATDDRQPEEAARWR